MKFFILFLIVFSQPSLASKKLNLKPQPEKKMEDPASAEHLLYESPTKVEQSSINKNPKLRANSSCTDQLGMIHNNGDKGYESCLRNMSKTQPGNSDPRRSSVGISIGN